MDCGNTGQFSWALFRLIKQLSPFPVLNGAIASRTGPLIVPSIACGSIGIKPFCYNFMTTTSLTASSLLSSLKREESSDGAPKASRIAHKSRYTIPVAFSGEARAQVPCTTFRLEDTRSERLALERYLDSLAGSVQPTLS